MISLHSLVGADSRGINVQVRPEREKSSGRALEEEKVAEEEALSRGGAARDPEGASCRSLAPRKRLKRDTRNIA